MGSIFSFQITRPSLVIRHFASNPRDQPEPAPIKMVHSPSRKIRVLCLHGYRTNAKVMEMQTLVLC